MSVFAETHTINAQDLAEKSIQGEELTREEAMAVLNWPADDILNLMQGAFRVRQEYFGKRVKLNFLLNVQSGICPEDCGYCSQSRDSDAPVDKYKLMGPDDILEAAEKAIANKATRLCMVASMRGPTDKDVNSVASAIRRCARPTRNSNCAPASACSRMDRRSAWKKRALRHTITI